MISYRWGGVGWGNTVLVPVHTQARRSCYVVTSSSSDLQDVLHGLHGLHGLYGLYGLYGYRRMERFERTQQFHNRKWNSLDLSGTDLERVWNRDWNEATHSSTYVVTSSVSKLQNVPDTLQHLLQVTCQMFLIRCNIFCAWLARRSWYL